MSTSGDIQKGSWLLAEELFERGDPGFVQEIRRIDDADRLAKFAERWFNDRRPAARELLFAYLELPLNAYRHEGLVKRLFKLSEAAGDDELMGRFLVLFDRSMRRVRKPQHCYLQKKADTQDEANRIAAELRATTGRVAYIYSSWSIHRKQTFYVSLTWTEDKDVLPCGLTMPRETVKPTSQYVSETARWEQFPAAEWTTPLRLDAWKYRNQKLVPPELRPRLEKFRLFKTATRCYLRRRSWRYFRRLAHKAPERYRASIARTLALYRDDDVRDATALLDNWSLIHVLFHNSEALESLKHGWRLRKGQTLNDLQPSPYRASLWNDSPRTLFEILASVRCRTVRVWATRLAQRDINAVFRSATLEEWLELFGRDDPQLARLVETLIQDAPGLREIPIARWRELAARASSSVVPILASLMEWSIDPAAVTLTHAIALAILAPIPFARLGLRWLNDRTPGSPDEYQSALTLLDAQADALRPDLLRWLRLALARRSEDSAEVLTQDILTFLDSRHADARKEGWSWFQAEPRVREQVELWQRLLESPYDDIRLPLAAELDAQVDRGGAWLPRGRNLPLSQDRLQLLWATVLLNTQRGGRQKPGIARQICGRIASNPDEAPVLLPILAVALRSVRGPEWRAGLTAIVSLIERSPGLSDEVRKAFPELSWSPTPS